MTLILFVKDHIDIKSAVRVIDLEVHMNGSKKEKRLRKEIGIYVRQPFMFNYKDLQVHHIISIEEDYSRRLDSTNLITLCPMHHKKAEQGIITREELLKMIKEK